MRWKKTKKKRKKKKYNERKRQEGATRAWGSRLGDQKINEMGAVFFYLFISHMGINVIGFMCECWRGVRYD